MPINPVLGSIMNAYSQSNRPVLGSPLGPPSGIGGFPGGGGGPMTQPIGVTMQGFTGGGGPVAGNPVGGPATGDPGVSGPVGTDPMPGWAIGPDGKPYKKSSDLLGDSYTNTFQGWLLRVICGGDYAKLQAVYANPDMMQKYYQMWMALNPKPTPTPPPQPPGIGNSSSGGGGGGHYGGGGGGHGGVWQPPPDSVDLGVR